MHPAAVAYIESRSPFPDQVQQGAIASSTPRLRRLAHRLGDARDDEHGGFEFEDDDRFEFS